MRSSGTVHKTGMAVQQDGEHAKAFPPLDPNTYAPQLIWLAITFGLLYLLVRRLFLPTVGAILDERSGRIKGDHALTEKLNRDTEAAIAAYERALADARVKANVVAQGLRETLADETHRERAKVETRITHMLGEAESRITTARTKALGNVGEIASDVAGAIVSRLIDKEVTTDEVRRALAQRAAE
jgi:F-type H+-transporting ATPase subunit b